MPKQLLELTSGAAAAGRRPIPLLVGKDLEFTDAEANVTSLWMKSPAREVRAETPGVMGQQLVMGRRADSRDLLN